MNHQLVSNILLIFENVKNNWMVNTQNIKGSGMITTVGVKEVMAFELGGAWRTRAVSRQRSSLQDMG